RAGEHRRVTHACAQDRRGNATNEGFARDRTRHGLQPCELDQRLLGSHIVSRGRPINVGRPGGVPSGLAAEPKGPTFSGGQLMGLTSAALTLGVLVALIAWCVVLVAELSCREGRCPGIVPALIWIFGMWSASLVVLGRLGYTAVESKGALIAAAV